MKHLRERLLDAEIGGHPPSAFGASPLGYLCQDEMVVLARQNALRKLCLARFGFRWRRS